MIEMLLTIRLIAYPILPAPITTSEQLVYRTPDYFHRLLEWLMLAFEATSWRD
jgi:hypothetical protein